MGEGVSPTVGNPGREGIVSLAGCVMPSGRQSRVSASTALTQVTAGCGKISTSGLTSNAAAREATKGAFDFFKANVGRISSGVNSSDRDFHLHLVEMHNTGAATAMTPARFIALASGAIQKPLQDRMVVLGDMSLGGSVKRVDNLAECLQVAFDAGAKRILIPMASATDIATVPAELFTKFQTSFYADPVDAVFKAIGI
jgi:ATP-dependent Lon protease